MFYIITNRDNVIMRIGTDITPMADQEGTLWLDGCGYALFGQKLHEVSEVPEGVVADVYTYDGEVFAPYISEIDRIKQEAIDEYTLELIEGGLL